MALTSPGVEVTVIDESNYLPAATNSVPYILIATAQNKISGTGTGVAAGTTAANANKCYLITSQRDLAATFGTPFFYSTSAGTAINGYELNEYGLLAAYSTLGVSNRAYVQRADVDLSQLTATLTRPTGDPADGTYWFDTGVSTFGVFEWSSTTQTFTNKVPTVITKTADLVGGISSGVPLASIGSIGDYAVNTTNTNNPVYLKSPGNTVSSPAVTANSWVLVGSDAWKNSWPTIIGTATNPTISAGNSMVFNDITITSSGTSLSTVASDINGASVPGVSAKVVDGKLNIYVDSNGSNDGSTDNGNGILMIDDGNNSTLLTEIGIATSTSKAGKPYFAPVLHLGYNYENPSWQTTGDEPHPTGSVWWKTNNVNVGANYVIKEYAAATDTFSTLSNEVHSTDQSALKSLDPAGGGLNIAAGTLFTQANVQANDTLTFKFLERLATGPTLVTGNTTTPTFTNLETFTIQASQKNTKTLTAAVTATLGGTSATDFVTAFTAANVANTTARVLSTGAVQIEHTLGGVIYLKDTSGTPCVDAGFVPAVTTGQVRAGNNSEIILSNFIPLGFGSTPVYTASSTAPSIDPADGTNWYFSATDQNDIMIQSGGTWKGYQNVTLDQRGFDLSATSPNGPIVSSTPPTKQSDDSALVFGDLWISTADLDNWPKVYRWQNVDSVNQWVILDNTDQTTQNGIVFADMRWADDGSTDPITGEIDTIKTLLTSDYVDLDKPDPTLYPEGILVFNTRRSGFNVKAYQVDYFNSTDFPFATFGALPAVTDAWVTASGNNADGSPSMGRKAVRKIVVAAMKAAVDGSQELREEQKVFNLLCAPNYEELASNLVALNNERNNTGFILSDAPMRLADNATDITNYATNANGDGLTTADPYFGVFYPSCQTNDLSGTTVVAPATHMMLRTTVRSDDVAFPWLAPAGTRRGTVDNASAIGYVDAATGEFEQTAVRQGLRDTLYANSINPITFIPGSGILNYGNKTTFSGTSLDRINVSRLVAFVRGRLETIGKNFVFEPNDTTTRDEIKNAIESLMIDLVAKRGIYDFLVVCDDSNNTPTRIDANELYVDVAIEPVKAVEFIFIPVRIKNTGEISAGNVASSGTVGYGS